MAAAMEADEERMCRYCFENDEEGDLIDPCACKGGQRWVHLKCLRRWQRMVLVSQPTHPMFHRDDVRQHKCNVCATEFTCAPPTRHELMASFTGAEITALVEEGCVIGAGAEFTRSLEAQLATLPPGARESSSYDHWVASAYLITGVDEGAGHYELEVDTADSLQHLRGLVDERLVISLRGKRLRVTARGGLASAAAAGPGSAEALQVAFDALVPPTSVVFEEVDEAGEALPRSCGDDHVTAVNLTRECGPAFARRPHARRAVDAALAKVADDRGVAWGARAKNVHVAHYVGGPCDDGELVRCVVLGAGGARGWKVVTDLSEAVYVAARLAARRRRPSAVADDGAAPDDDDGLAPGLKVRITGLVTAPELNGALALLLRYDAATQRWLVRVASATRQGDAPPADAADGEADAAGPASPSLVRRARVLAVKTCNLVLEGGSAGEAHRGGTVLAFWGDARWSRTQLLGEIARGHWGMCVASLAELVAEPSQRRAQLEGRLVFAPTSAMTDEAIVASRAQMHAVRGQAVAAAAAALDDETPRRASDADADADTEATAPIIPPSPPAAPAAPEPLAPPTPPT
ncbi:hypothetical protein M885DRAFT_506403 [Pelagophyceae sp. CCMP2097]|nr:hypothetical protein M885DRAFT_506403 [Pelagophyceae sp. CCMP2097]